MVAVVTHLNISVSSPLNSATMTGKPTQAGTRYSRAGCGRTGRYGHIKPSHTCVVLKLHLCMFEGVHDEDGETQSQNVGQETGVEVGSAVLL